MKVIILILAACSVFYGCASTQPAEMPDKLPKLIEQEPFPPMTEALAKAHPEFDLKLQIGEQGTVLFAELLSPSGDAAWDALALQRISKWKFSPAIHDGKPLRIWITVRACVRCAEPHYMALAELVCPNSIIADSVHSLLLAGEDFRSLVARFSVAATKTYNGDLGEVDINRYAENVQQVLGGLKENEFTKPLVLGERYVIFKRIQWDIRLQ